MTRAEPEAQWARIVEEFEKLDPYAQKIVEDEIAQYIEINRERKRLGRDPDAPIN